MNRLFTPPITASLSPNTERDDVWLAAHTLLSPWRWHQTQAVEKVEQWFSKTYAVQSVLFFNSGRSALLALLRSFSISDGDEVIVQAFTCVAVPNSVIWAGATPVYVDIDEAFNITISDLRKKITKKTKAIIVQHTFGIPAKIDEIITIASKHNIIVIEDCAHALGASYKGRMLGTWGDAAFFSFGRDKVVSSVFGGAAFVNAKCKMPNAKLIEYQNKLAEPNMFWIIQQLLHPVAFAAILATYNTKIGKVILVVLQKLNLLSKPVFREECETEQPHVFPQKYTNALAMLLVNQLAKLDRYNNQRREIVEYYRRAIGNYSNMMLPNHIDGAIYLRFPILVENPKELILNAKKRGILLGNWYHNVIDPSGVNFKKAGYTRGSCPQAEYAAAHILNLPTRITQNQAQQVVQCLKAN